MLWIIEYAERALGRARWLAALCAGLGLPLAMLPAQVNGAVGVGGTFPSLERFGLEGSPPDHLSGQVVLVDFWASWCAPCKASFPVFAQLQREYAERGLVILAVSVDDQPNAYAGFVAHAKPPFVTLRDAHHQLVAEVDVPTMPTSFLLDRRGVVRFLHSGFHSKTPAQLRAEIDQLLAEKS